MGLIGNIGIGMNIDTTSLSKGLDSAAQKMSRWSKTGAAELSKGLASLVTSGKGLDSIGSGLGKISTAPLAAGLKGIASVVGSLPSMIKTAAMGFAGMAVASSVALGSFVMASADMIDSTGDAADRLSMTTAALSEMRYAAKLTGSDAESLDAALTKMNANLGDSAIRGGPAAMALERIGLDAKRLATIDPAEAFKAISGGFALIPSAAEKASIAMDIFGKGGASLLNTLSAGPKQLQEFAEEFRNFGGSVTESQRQSVGAMFDAFDKIKAIVAGVGTQLAVGLSPFITAAADSFVQMGSSGQSMASRVTNAIEQMAMAIAKAADLAQGLEKTYKSVGTAFDTAKTQIGMQYSEKEAPRGAAAWVTDKVRKQGEDLNKTLGAKSYSSEVAESFAKIRSRADEMGNAAAKAGGSIKAISGDFVSTNAKVSQLTEGIQAQIAAFGKSSHEVELQKLAQAGANAEALAGVRALDMQLAGMEEFKKAQDKLKDDAKTLAESVRTPFEALGEELAKLQKMKEAGFINQEQFDRGKAKAKGKAEGDKTPFAGAFEAGSKESYSAIVQAQFRKGGDNTPKEQLAVAKTGLEYQKQLVDYQAKIAEALTAKRNEAVAAVGLASSTIGLVF